MSNKVISLWLVFRTFDQCRISAWSKSDQTPIRPIRPFCMGHSILTRIFPSKTKEKKSVRRLIFFNYYYLFLLTERGIELKPLAMVKKYGFKLYKQKIMVSHAFFSWRSTTNRFEDGRITSNYYYRLIWQVCETAPILKTPKIIAWQGLSRETNFEKFHQVGSRWFPCMYGNNQLIIISVCICKDGDWNKSPLIRHFGYIGNSQKS